VLLSSVPVLSENPGMPRSMDVSSLIILRQAAAVRFSSMLGALCLRSRSMHATSSTTLGPMAVCLPSMGAALRSTNVIS
jgi:hypothetical protein